MAAASQKKVEGLLAACEELVSDNTHFHGKEWKLSQYVIALRKQVTQLETQSSVDRDKMAMFQNKLSVLEDIVHNQSSSNSSSSSSSSSSYQKVPVSSEEQEKQPVEVPPDKKKKKLLSQWEREARAELFGQSATGSVRHRTSTSGGGEGSEVAKERQRRNQENIAEEMMGLARSLKENAMAAKNIIVNDNKALKETNKKAEDNITSVDTQTGRIKEHNRGCPWGTILLLVVVFLLFLGMVILIRFIPKPR